MADEKMVKMNLDRTWLHRGQYYGPGAGVQVPVSLREALRRSGASPEARMVPAGRGGTAPDAESVTTAQPYDGSLPEGFPYADRLREAGIESVQDLRTRRDALTEIQGIGPVSNEELTDALAMMDRGEGVQEDSENPGAYRWVGSKV